MAVTSADYEAIHNLYGRYSIAIDTGDIDAVLECFAPGAVVTYEGLPDETGRNRPFAGHEDIRALSAGVYAGTQGHVLHVQLIQTIEIDGDEARVSVYGVVIRRGQAPHAGVVLTETAQDTLVRQTGTWRYLKRAGRMDAHDAVPASSDVLVLARDAYVDAVMGS